MIIIYNIIALDETWEPSEDHEFWQRLWVIDGHSWLFQLISGKNRKLQQEAKLEPISVFPISEPLFLWFLCCPEPRWFGGKTMSARWKNYERSSPVRSGDHTPHNAEAAQPYRHQVFSHFCRSKETTKVIDAMALRPLLHCKGGRKTAIAQFTLDSSALFCMPWQKARRKGQVQQAMNQGCWFWNRAYKSVTSMPYYLVGDFFIFLLSKLLTFDWAGQKSQPLLKTKKVIKCDGNRCHAFLGRGYWNPIIWWQSFGPSNINEIYPRGAFHQLQNSAIFPCIFPECACASANNLKRGRSNLRSIGHHKNCSNFFGISRHVPPCISILVNICLLVHPFRHGLFHPVKYMNVYTVIRSIV